jgi:hypothetical protein
MPVHLEWINALKAESDDLESRYLSLLALVFET